VTSGIQGRQGRLAHIASQLKSPSHSRDPTTVILATNAGPFSALKTVGAAAVGGGGGVGGGLDEERVMEMVDHAMEQAKVALQVDVKDWFQIT